MKEKMKDAKDRSREKLISSRKKSLMPLTIRSRAFSRCVRRVGEIVKEGARNIYELKAPKNAKAICHKTETSKRQWPSIPGKSLAGTGKGPQVGDKLK